MPIRYERLPLNPDDDLDNDFKDKPFSKRRFHIHLPSLPSISFAVPKSIFKKARRVCRPIYIILVLVILFILQITLNASYIHPPPFTPHPTETVFIAANIIDGDLITGAWGTSLLDLVDKIGKDRVFVSIYGGPSSALKHLESLLECESSIVSETEAPISLDTIPRTKLPTGDERIKRIAYLAEVRNRALLPLTSGTVKRKYDRVLFINDVFFSASDAERLLWGTNVDPVTNVAQYKAVCGADFVKDWKFYDTYGTRDYEGYSIGVPIFPWFTTAGEGQSRRDVLAGKDAVRVKSCWGGIVAFDGRYFQAPTPPPARVPDDKREEKKDLGAAIPLTFRAEAEPFWDSSECCLIHADILSFPEFPSSSKLATSLPPLGPGDGIFMNPYVRVAYDASTFSKLPLIKRRERLMTPWHTIINYFAGMPYHNYRRTEREGQEIDDKIWVANPDFHSVHDFGDEDGTWQGSDSVATSTGNPVGTGIGAISRRGFPFFGEIEQMSRIVGRAQIGHEKAKQYWAVRGHYESIKRTAGRGGYCGVRQLLVLKEGSKSESEGNWDRLMDQVPPLDV
jgi:hypothetical protein